MHIGYFSSIIGTQGGPAIFDKRAIEAIAQYDSRNTYTILGLNDQATRDLTLNDTNFSIRTVKPSGKWLGVALGVSWEIKRRPVDLLHATYVPPPFVPGKFLMTISCWSQYSQPEFYPPFIRWRLLFLLNQGIRNAVAFCCYTDYLKQKLMEKFNIPEELIFLTQPGVGEEMQALDSQVVESYLKRQGISGPYILFIGKLTRRKNVTRLLRAYDLWRKETKLPHKLVLVGEVGFYSKDIFQTVEELNLADSVIFTGRRPHNELPFFYNGADVFVFPTLSEGFGLPPLEAMACGTPVVTSNITSVPEVVGDAALLIDPNRFEDIAEAMHACLADQVVRNDLIEKGKQRARLFTWEKTARQTISAYETIHNTIL